MRARDIMNSPVVTVQPWRPVKEVATLLIDHEITALPVLDADGHLVGIVTEADLVSLEKDPDPRAHILPPARRSKRPARTVEELMTKQVVWVHPEADAAEVADLMWTNRIRSIPVVAEDKVVGIITRRDLIRVLARSDGDIAIEVEDLLDDEALMIGKYRAHIEGGVVTLSGPTDRDSRRLVELLARSVPGVIAVRFGKAS